MSVDDSEFMSFAEDFEKQEANRNANRGTGGGFNREYEQIKWTGLEPNRTKIVRVLGGIPNSPNADAFTARIVQVGWIKGDNGKSFRCVLPLRDTDAGKDHLLWRIIQRVNETAYINRKRVYVNETKHKEIFDLVNYNGLADTDPKRKFDKGWEGRHVIVMNVIDREQMDWHRENKHTMLLSRNIGRSADGTREYPEEGVPVYGFFNVIATTLFKHYGNWEGYDIGITRLGTTQQPYRLINATMYASANIPELPPEMKNFVSLGTTLTDEERSWARYDLNKIYGPTTYTKIYNNLQVAIRRIDATLGTQFIKELEYEVEKEKAERAARQQQEAPSAPIVESTVSAATVAQPSPTTTSAPSANVTPTRTRTAPAAATSSIKLTADKIGALKGWSQISDEQKAMITDVTVDKAGKVIDIKFDTNEGVLGCPQCRVPAPESFTVCPSCGFDFNAGA